jgi:hypothetical protein
MGAFVFSAPSLLEIADIPDAFSRNRSQAWTGTGQNAVAAFDPVWSAHKWQQPLHRVIQHAFGLSCLRVKQPGLLRGDEDCAASLGR